MNDYDSGRIAKAIEGILIRLEFIAIILAAFFIRGCLSK